ncbi:SHOCT domain-containing protein [Planosporangium thailandense]|uniref:SHOCT domain-containing protein n=1 Tax=Planosporangium thailandense TaxID=765197 RepID=A0ABX0Y0A3_9ACTN|nr:SHOCT domain-containing protein [Planosporangium thailandense]NJC71478.1 SHOCT domain-containing protein [Planosporangium thailandense]
MNYPLLDAFLTMLWFFLWVLWIFLVGSIIVDIFRSPDLGGWAKAGWTFLVIVLPLVGVLAYLIARGGKMHERQVRAAQIEEQRARSYIREAAGGGNAAELKTLTELKDRGVINMAEYEREKAKILS